MLEATNHDNAYTLWKKIAYNFYEVAIAAGVSGLNPPNWNDPKDILIKKTAYYTASLS